MTTDRYKLCGVVNARNLSTKVVLLLSEVEGVRDNVTFQVSREADLDLASGIDVLWHQIRKSSPRTLSLVSNEVGVLVHTEAATFATLGSAILRQVLGLKGLHNVVVVDCASDLTPKTE